MTEMQEVIKYVKTLSIGEVAQVVFTLQNKIKLLSKAKEAQRPRDGDKCKECQHKEISNSLAVWSEKYPRSRGYHSSMQASMDGELISLETLAKQAMKEEQTND